LASGAQTRMRGTMLWFNAEKNVGALRTDAGDRLEIAGDAFAPGEKPTGRCAGLPVEFDVLGVDPGGIVFVPDLERRRARLRRSR
jgi:hypothetical protein